MGSAVAATLLVSGCGQPGADLAAAREDAVAVVATLPWVQDSQEHLERITEASSVAEVEEVVADARAINAARDSEYWACRADAGFSTSGYPLSSRWGTVAPGSGGQDVVQLWARHDGAAQMERVEGASAVGVPEAPNVAWLEERVGKVATWNADFKPMTIEKRVEKLAASPSELLTSGASCSMPFRFVIWVEIDGGRYETFRAWMSFSMQENVYSLVLTDPDSGERVAEFSQLKDA